MKAIITSSFFRYEMPVESGSAMNYGMFWAPASTMEGY